MAYSRCWLTYSTGERLGNTYLNGIAQIGQYRLNIYIEVILIRGTPRRLLLDRSEGPKKNSLSINTELLENLSYYGR
ncbi:MAG: hypothetical protein ACTS8R_04695 [Arsenophonus sp. NC-QC1-MAG3]